MAYMIDIIVKVKFFNNQQLSAKRSNGLPTVFMEYLETRIRQLSEQTCISAIEYFGMYDGNDIYSILIESPVNAFDESQCRGIIEPGIHNVFEMSFVSIRK